MLVYDEFRKPVLFRNCSTCPRHIKYYYFPHASLTTRKYNAFRVPFAQSELEYVYGIMGTYIYI